MHIYIYIYIFIYVYIYCRRPRHVLGPSGPTFFPGPNIFVDPALVPRQIGVSNRPHFLVSNDAPLAKVTVSSKHLQYLLDIDHIRYIWY